MSLPPVKTYSKGTRSWLRSWLRNCLSPHSTVLSGRRTSTLKLGAQCPEVNFSAPVRVLYSIPSRHTDTDKPSERS